MEKLVNITAVFTLEHTEVSYTQGMTDLLSPILYVMEREDDAYIVFSAMVQRISDNFGIWCEGTLKKIERLRHLCSVLDPQLSAYLDSIQDDAFALFFGMVLIECRREFSFESSFRLLEVIWAAALCMRQREDPNWSPLATPRRRRHRRIQVSCSEVSDDLDAVPSYSEWASFMSNRSPDLIRQVFGELQTYSAIPLTRSESILCHSITNSTTYPPPPPPHPHTPPPVTERHVYTSSREQASGHTVVQAERGRDLCRADTTGADDIENETIKSEETKMETCEDEILRREESGYCEEVTRELSKFEEDENLSFNSIPSHENDVREYNGHQGDDVPATTAQGDRVCRLNSLGKERSYSAPTANNHIAGSNCSHETREKCLNSATTDDVPKFSAEQQQLTGEHTAVLADVKSRSKSHSEGEAVDNRRQLSNGQMQTMVSADDKRNELLLSEGEVVDNRFPLNKTTVQAQTEMSDMSSVGSNNTASGGGNDRGASGDGEGREGEEGEGEGEGGEGEGEGGEREGEGEGEVKMDVEGEGGSEQEDSDDQWLVVVPDSLETITQERNHSFDSGNTCDASPKPKPDVVRANNSSSAQLTSSPKLNGGGCHGNLEEHHPVDFDLETPHCVPWQPNWNSRPALSREPSSVVSMTPQHTAAAALATNGSPSTEEHEEMLRRRSFTEERDYTRSPKQPFFDALETIATISRTASPAPGVDGIPRPNSGLSAIITNLLSMERSAPAVTQESSLTVPFSDSFPLFICLAIIVQHRGQIIQGNLDFVGLSVLLNMQAGKQKLDRTLYVARQLYTRYREYQRQCFGPRFSVYEVWLDNMGTLFDVANSSNGSQRYGDGPAG